jgi:predicted dehydrogenase
MIRIGLVGVGFMGWIHFLAYQRLRGAALAAVCSRDKVKLAGDWRSIRGNFGPPGEMVNLEGVKRYERFEDMVADPQIDLIDVCNPTHLHPDYAIAALKTGKHVLVEKAIALKPEQADAMVAAAKAAGKMLMVAHVLPFFPEFKYAAEVIRDQPYGRLLAGSFKRVISRPDWSADIGDAAKTGGPAIDLHVHDTHFIGLACGVPKSVFSTGVVENGVVQHLTTAYDFGLNGPSVTCTSGALAMSGRPFVHGYELYFEKATLVYMAGTCPLTRVTSGKSEIVELPGGGDPITAFADEIQTAVDGVAGGKMPELLSGQLARDALVMCYKECESVVSRKPVAMG